MSRTKWGEKWEVIKIKPSLNNPSPGKFYSWPHQVFKLRLILMLFIKNVFEKLFERKKKITLASGAIKEYT